VWIGASVVALAAAAPSPFVVRWSAVEAGSRPLPPVADGDAVFVGFERSRLAARALADGSPRWAVDLDLAHAPAAGGGLIFAAAAEALHALEATTGRTRWTRPLALAASPTWRAGWLLAGDSGGTLVALRAADGEELWRQPLGAPLAQPPEIDGDRAYAPLADGRIVALGLATGARRWERRLDGRPAPPLARGGRVYVGSTDNFFYCLDDEDGDVEWRWRTGADILGAPIVDEARVYFLSLDNVLRALDRGSGVLRWKRPLDLRPIAGPFRVDGAVLVAGLSPTLRAFAAKDGAPAGEFTAPAEPAAPPVVIDPPAAGVRVVLVTGAAAGEWRVLAAGHAQEPPLAPLLAPPGRPLAPPAPPRRR
jgi:outer membrane protein assembly factor BamB